jgi:hypothetical protein
MTIHLKDLLINDRDNTYKKILEFLDLENHEKMSTFFNTTMHTENDHPDHWKSEIPNDQITIENIIAEKLAQFPTLEQNLEYDYSYLAEDAFVT